MNEYLPSTKVASATVVAGALSAWLSGVDWQSLVVALATLVLSYLVPELNPPPSAVKRIERGE